MIIPTAAFDYPNYLEQERVQVFTNINQVVNYILLLFSTYVHTYMYIYIGLGCPTLKCWDCADTHG